MITRIIKLTGIALILIALIAGGVIAIIVSHQFSSGPRPVGEWMLVKSGNWEELSWNLYQTAPNNNGRCLALEFEPSTPAEELDTEDQYRGKTHSCGPDPGGRSRSQFVQFFQAVSFPREGFKYVIGKTDSSVTAVEASFDRRRGEISESLESERVDTGDGFIVLFFGLDSDLVALEPLSDGRVLKHCTTDRNRLLSLSC